MYNNDNTGIIRFGWNGMNQISSKEEEVIPPSTFSEIAHHKIRDVALGSMTTIFVTKQGLLIGCGSDLNGILLGNGKIDKEKKVKVPIQLKLKFKVLKCFCGATHIGAIDFFRNLHTWGCNEFGQLGRLIDIDNKIEYEPEICIKDVPVKEIALGFSHTIILLEEGKVMVCGDGKKGQLGLGMEKVLSHENQKWIEQYISTYQPTFMKDFEHLDIVSIAAGDYHSIFLDAQGFVYSCGDNTYGRLGFASKTFVGKPKKLTVFGSKKHRKVIIDKNDDNDEAKKNANDNNDDKKQKDVNNNNNNNDNNDNKKEEDVVTESYTLKAMRIGSGGASNYAIANDNNVYTWGFNSRGQLGQGTFNDCMLPTPLQCFGNNTEIIIIDIAMGEDHTIFLSDTGNLYACGLGSSGRLGIALNNTNGNIYSNNNNNNAINEESFNIPFLIPDLPFNGDMLTKICCGGAHFVGVHIIEDQEGFVKRMRKQIAESEIAEKKRLAIINHEKEVLRQKKEAEVKEKETARMFKDMKEEFDRARKEMEAKKNLEERQRLEAIEKKKREEEEEEKKRQIEREKILMEKKRLAQEKREAEELAKRQRELKRKEEEKAKALAEQMRKEKEDEDKRRKEKEEHLAKLKEEQERKMQIKLEQERMEKERQDIERKEHVEKLVSEAVVTAVDTELERAEQFKVKQYKLEQEELERKAREEEQEKEAARIAAAKQLELQQKKIEEELKFKMEQVNLKKAEEEEEAKKKLQKLSAEKVEVIVKKQSFENNNGEKANINEEQEILSNLKSKVDDASQFTISKNNVKNAGKMKYQKGHTNNNTNSNGNKNKKEKEKNKKTSKDDNKSNEIKTFEWIG